MTKHIPWKRRINLILMIIFLTALSMSFAFRNHSMPDGYLSYLILDGIYIMMMLYLLENNRIHGQLHNNPATDYKMLMLTFGGLCLCFFFWYYMPIYTAPVAVASLLLGAVANPMISVSLTFFLSMSLCMATGAEFYEIVLYGILILIGAELSVTLRQKRLRIYASIILLVCAGCLPELFYYMAYAQNHDNALFFRLIVNGVLILCFNGIAVWLYDRVDHSAEDALRRLISEDYPLLKEIKAYSKAEYVHAMKVSTIARKCAKVIDADEFVVAAAGFYYRVGILEGEPFIQNGVLLAKENCFPDSVVSILAEYHGEEQTISTRESAIVHMVDACVIRMEMLTSKNLSSTWNQDMMIYQTLNELSETGIYDMSGLSMNQFLKIRELLVREDIGYDN